MAFDPSTATLFEVEPQEQRFDPSSATLFEEVEEAPKEATVGGEAVKGFKQLASAYQTAYETLAGNPEEAVRAGMKRREQFIKEYGQTRGLEEFLKVYGEDGMLAAGAEFASQVPTALAGQAATLTSMAGAGKLGAGAGAAIGTAIAPGAGTAIGATIGGTGGAILSQVFPFYVENLEAQLRAQEERGEPIDLNRAKAAAYATMQASAEVGGTVLAFGKRLVGKIIGSKPAEEAREALVKAASQSLAGAVTKGAARATVAELPVELAQNILTRDQAGESLTSDEAFEDYKNTLFETLKVAGPLGGAAGPVNRAAARSELARREATEAPPVAEEVDRELVGDITGKVAPTTPEEVSDLEARITALETAPTDIVEPTPETTPEAVEEAVAEAPEIPAPSTVTPVAPVAPAAPTQFDPTSAVPVEEAPATVIPPVTPPVTPTAPEATPVQGDQNAPARPDSTGVGVGTEVSGQLGGVPPAATGRVDRAGVDIVRDISQPPQDRIAQQPDTLTPAAPKVQAPVITPTETGMEVMAERKIAKPIKFVEGYKPTPVPSVDNFLNQNSTYGAEAPLTVERGIRMAAGDQAFDIYDSAYGKVANTLRKLANQQNKAEGVEGKYSFERPLEFMPIESLVDLFKQNAGARTKFEEGGKARIDAAKNRAAFVESLAPEQRAQYDQALEEMVRRTVAAEATGRREAIESDERKQREKQERQVKRQKEALVQDVQEQVAQAEKTDEQIAAEEQAEAEAFAREQETADKEEKADLAEAVKSEQQIEAEAVQEAAEEVKQLPVKRTLVQRRLESAIRDTGDIKSALDEIAQDKESNVGAIARNLVKVFKNIGITDPTPKRISFGRISGGNDGAFVPSKNRIYVAGADGQYAGNRDLSELVVHETLHYYTDHVIDNREAYLKSLEPAERAEAKAALNRLNLNYQRTKAAIGNRFNIPTIKEFIAEAFSNPEFQKAMINMDESGRQYKAATKNNMFVQFVKNVMSALGISPTDRGITFKETLEDVMQIVSAPGNGLYGRSVSYATTTQAKGAGKPISLYDDDPRYTVEGLKPKTLVQRITDTFTPDNLIRKFQNTKHDIKKVEDKASLSGLIKYSGKDKNDVYTEATLAPERASMAYKTTVLEPVKRLETAFNELVRASKSTVDKTIAMLGKIAVAQHEPERRTVKFLKTAPLRPQMADIRRQIFEILESPTLLSDAQVARLRKKLDSIMFELDQNGNVKIGPNGYPVVNTNNVTPLGFSPSDFKTTDIGHSDYTVVDMDNASVQNIMDEYRNHPQKATIDRLFAAVRDMEAGTRELNKVSNYWSNPVTNITKFYGWQNYVPMKARIEKDEFFDPGHRGRELQDRQYSFEGMDRTPDNPILQAMSDAARAASRAGRGDYTQTIKNAVEQKLIPGKVTKTIQFADRDQDLPEAKKANTIFNYNADGTVDVIEISDPNMLNSLRRTYKDSNPLVDAMNMATGFIGKMHTRWNYAFAPMNFIRDALTNAFVLGADFGPLDSIRMINQIAAQVGARGGLFKAAKVAAMYENGDIKGMEAYAKTSPFAKQIVEYLREGGAVSYTAGLSLKDKLQELNRELGRGKIVKTHEQFEKFVDVWNNMFEFSSRAAAYGVVKNRLLGQGMSEADARVRATAYVKNLANFEQTGEHGKLMGGLFMFFRPAATGAVRAIESVVPAFQSMNSALKRLPPAVLNNPAALAEYQRNYAIKQRNARIMVTSLMGLGAMTYLMSAAMADEDELGRNSVYADNMNQWNRYARFHIPNAISESLGLGKDVVFQMPWGFGLGAFAAAGAQLAAATAGRATLGEAMKNIFTDITLDSFIPLPVSKMEFTDNPLNFVIDSIAPSMARPLLQFVLNKDGLGRGIYNEPYRRMADAFSAGDRVPEMYKDAARYMFNELGIDVNPNSLYFLSNSFLDGVGRAFETTYGALGLAGEQPRNIKQESLIFGSFFGNKGNVDNKEFARIQAKLTEKQANLNAVKNDPIAYSRYMERNPLDEMLVQAYLKDINGDLKKLQAEAKFIRMAPKDVLSPAQRKEMLEPNLLMQRLIKANLVEKYKAFDINP